MRLHVPTVSKMMKNIFSLWFSNMDKLIFL